MRAENVCIRDTRTDMETDDKIVNVDDNYQDPQLCATIACDIYMHLRASEVEYSSLCANYESLL
jgi:cyclin A